MPEEPPVMRTIWEDQSVTGCDVRRREEGKEKEGAVRRGREYVRVTREERM
jgi:hypothetical protein